MQYYSMLYQKTTYDIQIQFADPDPKIECIFNFSMSALITERGQGAISKAVHALHNMVLCLFYENVSQING